MVNLPRSYKRSKVHIQTSQPYVTAFLVLCGLLLAVSTLKLLYKTPLLTEERKPVKAAFTAAPAASPLPSRPTPFGAAPVRARPFATTMAAAALTPATVRLVPAASLHVSKPVWWLTSRFHFSFADYWDSARMNFGALRVVNDDLVKGRAGFGTHPHRDAEIYSYVLDGNLTHADSMGNRESLGRGCVQYLSAGTGVTHSEMNDHEETCRFIQVWLTPDRRGHTPQYGSSSYEKADRHNRLLRVLGGTGAAPGWPGLHAPNAIHLHQDASVVVSESDAGVKHSLELGPARQAYLLCMEGALEANGARLDARDAARIRGTPEAATGLVLEAAAEGAHFMIIEMALSDD